MKNEREPVESQPRDPIAATGASKPAEPDDPMSLEGVCCPEGELEPMAAAFVEEFARLGMGGEEIYFLFLRQGYFATHLYFQRHGAEATRSLIDRVLSRSGVYCYREVEFDG